MARVQIPVGAFSERCTASDRPACRSPSERGNAERRDLNHGGRSATGGSDRPASGSNPGRRILWRTIREPQMQLIWDLNPTSGSPRRAEGPSRTLWFWFKSRTEHSRGRAPSDLPLAASRVPSVAVRPPRDALSGRVSLLSRESRSAHSEAEQREASTTQAGSGAAREAHSEARTDVRASTT